METMEDSSALVSYDGPPLAEIEIDGVEYRVDAGRGPAVAVSSRESGSVTWSVAAEGRFDGLRLKAKPLSYPVVEALSKALKAALKAEQEQAWG